VVDVTEDAADRLPDRVLERRIVIETDRFIVVDKPCRVLTVPGRGADEAHRPVLGRRLEALRRIRIFPVHRLDYPVSGLVLFAKDPASHREASGWFESRLIEKTYRAWTEPQTFAHLPKRVRGPRTPLDPRPGARFEWASRIRRGKRRAFESPSGKPSLTLATFLGRDAGGRFLVWDLSPRTGRPHQLRFELSRRGFPIAGDRLYGSRIDFGPDAIALRAYRLHLAGVDAGGRYGLPETIEVGADPECGDLAPDAHASI
jgi:tRNA pseudouridine32 synthase/23S rRNA pseudouridine746 synthase